MKSLDPISLDLNQCQRELTVFQSLLESKSDLSERADLLPFFRASPQLTALIGAQVPNIGIVDRIAYEFQILGDFVADIVIGNSATQTYCAIELEDARSDSIFSRSGEKATTEWGRRFEHGFSQLVDWFFSWDDHKKSDGFAKQFGYGQVDFSGMLLIGRSGHISEHDRTRLLWRSNKVTINSHKVICRTYDELYESLIVDWRLISLASHGAN